MWDFVADDTAAACWRDHLWQHPKTAPASARTIPTNHLDIEGQEALESAEVSCLFVSHDRYFTRTAANRFLEIRRGKLVEVDDPDAFFDAQGR